jgi:hypothetical protein
MRVWGVWDHAYEHDLLIGLYFAQSDAEAKASEVSAWEVEEHEVQGEMPQVA